MKKNQRVLGYEESGMNWKYFDDMFDSMDKLFDSIDWDSDIKTYKRTEIKTRPRNVYEKPPRKTKKKLRFDSTLPWSRCIYYG